MKWASDPLCIVPMSLMVHLMRNIRHRPHASNVAVASLLPNKNGRETLIFFFQYYHLKPPCILYVKHNSSSSEAVATSVCSYVLQILLQVHCNMQECCKPHAPLQGRAGLDEQTRTNRIQSSK
jgi:hypothetical protein